MIDGRQTSVRRMSDRSEADVRRVRRALVGSDVSDGRQTSDTERQYDVSRHADVRSDVRPRRVRLIFTS